MLLIMVVCVKWNNVKNWNNDQNGVSEMTLPISKPFIYDGDRYCQITGCTHKAKYRMLTMLHDFLLETYSCEYHVSDWGEKK